MSRATGVTCTGSRREASRDRSSPSFSLAVLAHEGRSVPARARGPSRGSGSAASRRPGSERTAGRRATACSRRTRSTRGARRSNRSACSSTRNFMPVRLPASSSVVSARMTSPGGRCSDDGDAHQRREEHRDAALHVERASPPHLAVDQVAAERRMSPLARVGRNDVDVAVQEQAAARPLGPRRARRGWAASVSSARYRWSIPARSRSPPANSTQARSLPGGFEVSNRIRAWSSSTSLIGASIARTIAP